MELYAFIAVVYTHIYAKWWAHLGSNQGPTGYEPVALPAELWARELWFRQFVTTPLKVVKRIDPHVA